MHTCILPWIRTILHLCLLWRELLVTAGAESRVKCHSFLIIMEELYWSTFKPAHISSLNAEGIPHLGKFCSSMAESITWADFSLSLSLCTGKPWEMRHQKLTHLPSFLRCTSCGFCSLLYWNHWKHDTGWFSNDNFYEGLNLFHLVVCLDILSCRVDSNYGIVSVNLRPCQCTNSSNFDFKCVCDQAALSPCVLAPE